MDTSTTATDVTNFARRQVENKNRKLSDFNLIRIIGTGTFGKVYLAVKDGNSYALKMMTKHRLIELQQIDHINNEKNILANVTHPFMVNLVESFKDKQMVYLVFDFVQGGEIFRLLRKENIFPNDVALFYIAEITLALEYLHQQRIAYRDLKPENLLIAHDGVEPDLSPNGHLRITDFGFAKIISDRSFTLCGTPEYLAPEIILGQGHNQGVDWWGLGVLMFEMLTGYPPFYDPNPLMIHEKIAIGYYEFPDIILMPARQMIAGLLTQNISQRLGCMAGGANDIKNSQWFDGVQWDMVLQKRIQPPWIPELTGENDYQYFDQYPDSAGQHNSITDQENELFESF